jgi:hypothetical protein
MPQKYQDLTPEQKQARVEYRREWYANNKSKYLGNHYKKLAENPERIDKLREYNREYYAKHIKPIRDMLRQMKKANQVSN